MKNRKLTLYIKNVSSFQNSVSSFVTFGAGGRREFPYFFHTKRGQDFHPTLLEVLNISRSISSAGPRMLFRV